MPATHTPQDVSKAYRVMESTDFSALLDNLHPHHHSQQCALCELMDWAKGKSLPEVWKQCPRVDWLIWLCGKMAGTDGWPTAESIVVAVRALNNYSPRFELRKAIEIANSWKVGRATLEELCDEIEAEVTAYGRTGGWHKPPGYGRFDALRDAADIVRRALKTPSACLEHGPRILIVNDEEQIREIIGSMLTSAGYKCEAVAGGLDALSLLEAGAKFDLLLTDLLNAPMDGFSLLQQAKEKFPNMPVIVVSAVNDKDLIDACIREGAYQYLTLPLEPEQLLAGVHCALEHRGFPSASRELSDIAYTVLRDKRHQYDARLLKEHQKGPNATELMVSATMNASDEMSGAIENATHTLRHSIESRLDKLLWEIRRLRSESPVASPMWQRTFDRWEEHRKVCTSCDSFSGTPCQEGRAIMVDLESQQRIDDAGIGLCEIHKAVSNTLGADWLIIIVILLLIQMIHHW